VTNAQTVVPSVVIEASEVNGAEAAVADNTGVIVAASVANVATVVIAVTAAVVVTVLDFAVTRDLRRRMLHVQTTKLDRR